MPKIGWKPSAETREKWRQAKLGKPQTPEHIANRVAALVGRKHPPRSAAWRAKASERMRGRPAWNKGIRPSAETCAKLAAANIGKHHSAETKLKMRMASFGKPKTAAHAAAISAGRTGMHPTDETRAKMSASAAVRAESVTARERLSAIAKLAGGFKGRHSAATKEKMRAKALGRPCQHAHREWYQGIAFRSSWEIRVAQAFDRLGIRWEYEPQRFFFKGERFTYLPDFFLPDEGAYWEVKGWFRDIDKIKIRAFRSAYPEWPLVVVGIEMIEMLERAAVIMAA